MSVSINVQYIKQARARKISTAFSTVALSTRKPIDEHFFDDEVSLFIEGPGHEDTAARIAALINEQVVRRDKPAIHQAITEFYEAIPHDDGPTYDGPDEEEAARLEQNERYEFEQAAQAQAEERTYNEEDRLGKEAHLRSVRRDDKPWTPHEDQIEEDVRAGRRDADGKPI